MICTHCKQDFNHPCPLIAFAEMCEGCGDELCKAGLCPSCKDVVSGAKAAREAEERLNGELAECLRQHRS